jgi:hypothetical protein
MEYSVDKVMLHVGIRHYIEFSTLNMSVEGVCIDCLGGRDIVEPTSIKHTWNWATFQFLQQVNSWN